MLREELPDWLLRLERDDARLFPHERIRFGASGPKLHAGFVTHPFVVALTARSFRRITTWLCEENGRRYPRDARAAWNRLRPVLTRAVFGRDGAVCRHCGTTEQLSIDHIVPVIAGGTNDLSNLQVLCMPCNSRKGARV